MRICELILLTSLLCSVSVYGQDSLKQDLTETLNIDLFGGGYYQAAINGKGIKLPDYIRDQRNVAIAVASDNPLFHGAYFFGLHTQVDLIEGASFHADFIGEHRGFSYGVYTTENMIVYPRAEFVLDKTIWVKDKTLRLFTSIGNKTNFQLHEGLTLYNLDAQGWKIFVQMG